MVCNVHSVDTGYVVQPLDIVPHATLLTQIDRVFVSFRVFFSHARQPSDSITSPVYRITYVLCN